MTEPKIISVANQKGGTGKTTTAMALAAVMGEQYRTLLVDVDPQGSATWWAGRIEQAPFDHTSDTDPDHLKQLRRLPYDVIVVDTPGSLEGHDVLEAVVRASDFVLLPTMTAALSLAPMVNTVAQIVAPAAKPYRVLLNAVDPRSPGEFLSAREFLARKNIEYLKAGVRNYKWHRQAALEGTIVTRPDKSDQYTRSAIGDVRRMAGELSSVLGGGVMGDCLQRKARSGQAEPHICTRTTDHNGPHWCPCGHVWKEEDNGG